MSAAYINGTFGHQVPHYTGPSVLVIDDVGITPFDRSQSNAFFQVVNRRYENRSATIITTNRGLPAGAELFGGDAVVAAAILDRLLDGAAVINIEGGSWRLREPGADPAAGTAERRARAAVTEASLTFLRGTASSATSMSRNREFR